MKQRLRRLTSMLAIVFALSLAMACGTTGAGKTSLSVEPGTTDVTADSTVAVTSSTKADGSESESEQSEVDESEIQESSSITTDDKQTFPKYDPPITVSAARSISDPMQALIDRQSDVLTNNIWFNSYRDELGIEVVYDWTTPGALYQEKLNQQIAANDIPDVFNASMMQFAQLVSNGMVHALDEVYEAEASDFTRQMMAEDNEVGLMQATIDGKLYALPNVGGNMDNASFWYIRTDWLEKLNLEPPKTMDDIERIMVAFTEDDPDGNGEDDTYGLVLTKDLVGQAAYTLDAFLQGYHAYTDAWVYVDDESVEYGSIQPEVRNGLERVAELFKRGAINPEFSVEDGTNARKQSYLVELGCLRASTISRSIRS